MLTLANIKMLHHLGICTVNATMTGPYEDPQGISQITLFSLVLKKRPTFPLVTLL